MQKKSKLNTKVLLLVIVLFQVFLVLLNGQMGHFFEGEKVNITPKYITIIYSVFLSLVLVYLIKQIICQRIDEKRRRNSEHNKNR